MDGWTDGWDGGNVYFACMSTVALRNSANNIYHSFKASKGGIEMISPDSICYVLVHAGEVLVM